MLFPFSSAEGASTFGVTGLVTPLRLQTGVSSFHVWLHGRRGNTCINPSASELSQQTGTKAVALNPVS